MHPGLKANLPFRRLDPPRSPTLHHLSTQKPHFLHQPLLRRVRLHEVSLRIPHRPDDRRHSVAKLRTVLKKRQKRFVTQFRRRHSRASPFRRIPTIARTRLNRTRAPEQEADVLSRSSVLPRSPRQRQRPASSRPNSIVIIVSAAKIARHRPPRRHARAVRDPQIPIARARPSRAPSCPRFPPREAFERRPQTAHDRPPRGRRPKPFT